jgi:hypothetical protein
LKTENNNELTKYTGLFIFMLDKVGLWDAVHFYVKFGTVAGLKHIFANFCLNRFY